MDKEFSYSVDVSNVGCHCNAAAYFIDMPGDIDKTQDMKYRRNAGIS